MNSKSEILLGIIIDRGQDYNIIREIDYIVSQLNLVINIFCVFDVYENVNYNLDVALILRPNISFQEIIDIGCKNVVTMSAIEQDFDVPNEIHIYKVLDGSSSYVLLKILMIVQSYNLNVGDFRVASATLIDIIENKANDFVEQSKFKDDNPTEIVQIINKAILYPAGKMNYFREEFSLLEEGSTEIKFDLRRFHFLQIDKIRLHPHDQPCVVYNAKFSVEYADGQTLILDDYLMDNYFTIDEKHYFLKNPPLIDFKPFSRVNPCYLYASFNLESIENSEYFKSPGTIAEIKDHYISLVSDNKVGGFWNREHLQLDNGCYKNKNVFMHLGPKSIGLDKLNNYLLDHGSELIQKRIFYPTHQREFYNREGNGSLFSLFSRKSDQVIISDAHKAKWLKKDLLESIFQTLVLMSEGFLKEEKLFHCANTFKNAKYVYYLRDSVEFAFEKYKHDVFFNKKTIKFDPTVLMEYNQIKYFFEIFKFLSPENLILKEFSVDYYSQSTIINDFFDIIGHPLSEYHDYEPRFDLSKISNVALEFRRLMNFFIIIDDDIACFLQQSLLEYSKFFLNYIWLSKEENDDLRAKFKDKLNMIFSIFNCGDGLKILEAQLPRNTNYIKQEITREEILDVMTFLQKKDDDMYTRLIIELKLTKGVITDNDDFNLIFTEV